MSAASTRVAVAGATGYIGRAVTDELLGRGSGVLALVRDAAAGLPGCDVRVADLNDPGAVAAALAEQRVDALVSCIASRSGVPDDAWRVDYRANCNLLTAASECGIRQFLLVSAICVQRPRLAFQHAKLAFESRLRESGIDFTIVRPTAFFKSLSGQIDRLRAGKPFLVFGDGRQTACKPIGESDLAVFIADCLEDSAARNAVLPIGGPGDAITPREQGELLFELMGRRPRFRSVPPGLFTVAHAALSPLGRLWPAAACKAELARIGHYYATESMLVWDPERARYDAGATPGTGSVTLRDYYRRILRDGLAGQELGEHKLF